MKTIIYSVNLFNYYACLHYAFSGMCCCRLHTGMPVTNIYQRKKHVLILYLFMFLVVQTASYSRKSYLHKYISDQQCVIHKT